MSKSGEYRDLGMCRPIARRDFLNGIAISIAGVSTAINSRNPHAQIPEGSGNYPQTLRDGFRDLGGLLEIG
jgi:hypothetical protein